MISWPLVKYVMTASLRDRLVIALCLLIAVGVSLAIFLGSAAVTETDRFAVVFAAGGLRFAGAAGLVLFVVFHIRRSFDSRDVEFLLSRPVSRACFILSHACAFSLLAAVIAALVVVAVIAVAPQSFGSGHILWGASILAEYIMIANVALFFAMVLPNAAAGALAVFALYVLSRIIGQILGIVAAGSAFQAVELLGHVMHVVALIVPRLDLMGQTSWLVYGPPADIGFGFIAVQGVVYTALVIAAALVDLQRRQF